MRSLVINISNHPVLLISLLISGLAFFVKGSIYLYIGSSVPFIFSVLFLGLASYVAFNSNKVSRRIIRILGAILTLWGVSRLSVELIFAFVSVTEAHIAGQFTFLAKTISLTALTVGIYCIRYGNKY